MYQLVNYVLRIKSLHFAIIGKRLGLGQHIFLPLLLMNLQLAFVEFETFFKRAVALVPARVKLDDLLDMLEVAVALASHFQGLERVLISQHIVHGAAGNLLSDELLLVVLETRRQAMRQLFQIGLGEERGGPAKLARRYCASRQLLFSVSNLLRATGYLLVPID